MTVDVFNLTFRQVETFALILTRVSALFTVAPVFGNSNIPIQVKAGAVGLISLLLFLTIPPMSLPVSPDTLTLAGRVLCEYLVGIAISYSAYLLFVGIQLAGQIIDIQTGFGLVNVLDPQSNTQVSIIGQFYYLMAILVFLAINGHHVLLRAMGDSFALVPPGSFSLMRLNAVSGPIIADFFSRLFIIALQVAAPAVVTLFLTTLAMGILSRTLPQMNIFIVGMPLNVLVGLIITYFSLQVMGGVLSTVVSSMSQNITNLLAAMAGT
jgi:flagellar biosynthetic protein FliR